MTNPYHKDDAVSIQLTVVDLSLELESDPEGDTLRTALFDRVLRNDNVVDAMSPLHGTTSSISTTTTNEATRECILRFVRPRDQYTALTSLLLKSRAFHQCYYRHSFSVTPPTSDDDDCTSHVKPVVLLPRTSHNKPYIPGTTCSSNIKNKNEKSNQQKACKRREMEEQESTSSTNAFPMNISHQYPLVGIVRQRLSCLPLQPSHCSDDVTTKPPPLLLGVDIVMFEDFNPRLYESRSDFLQVFRPCFRPEEWQSIHQLEAASSEGEGDYRRTKKEASTTTTFLHLQNFYVYWAMKEAYTKALGMGMGCPFSSFRIEVLPVRDEDGAAAESSSPSSSSSRHSLWRQIEQDCVNNKCTASTTAEEYSNNGVIDDSCTDVNHPLHSNNYCRRQCSITTYPTTTPENEQGVPSTKEALWEVVFLPQYGNSVMKNSCDTTSKDAAATGCICLCLGPVSCTPPRVALRQLDLHQETLTLDGLISFHTQR